MPFSILVFSGASGDFVAFASALDLEEETIGAASLRRVTRVTTYPSALVSWPDSSTVLVYAGVDGGALGATLDMPPRDVGLLSKVPGSGASGAGRGVRGAEGLGC